MEKINIIKKQKKVDKINVIVYNIDAGRNTLYTRVTEFTFKRYVISPVAGTPSGVLFLY